MSPSNLDGNGRKRAQECSSRRARGLQQRSSVNPPTTALNAAPSRAGHEAQPPAAGADEKSPALLLAIALFKLVKAVLLIALGVAALSLARDAHLVTTLRGFVHALGLNAHSRLIDRAVGKALGVDYRRLQELAVGTFVYAAVFLVEGTGLLLRKRWAEYLTTIVTASFVPFELYEMAHTPSVLKAAGIALNVAIVVYLIVRLRQKR